MVRCLDNEQILEVLEDIKTGIPYATIAKKYYVSRRTIGRIVHENGIKSKRGRKAYSEEKAQRMKLYRDSGMSCSEIARMFDCHRKTVYRCVQRLEQE